MSDIIERIMGKVHIVADCGCWVWAGACSSSTPVVGVGGRGAGNANVRRVIYEHEVGELFDGDTVVMTCGGAYCVNPDHMQVVDLGHARNGAGAQAKRSKTHCINGHPLAGDNLIVRRGGGRKCRICKNASMQRSREARRA